MSPRYPRILPVGEAAVTVEFGDAVAAGLNRSVHALDRRLQAAALPGIIETVPTYRSLLVAFDPHRLDSEVLRHRLLSWATAASSGDEDRDIGPSGRLIEIPVTYGGEDGPDLDAVAAHTGLDREAVIERHASQIYQVAMLGFAPGFTYLLGLHEELATPRLETPRLRVPRGSVGIAGGQTGLYALSTPGGWRIIGRTPLTLFDPHREDPFLIKAGDSVRFAPSRGDR